MPFFSCKSKKSPAPKARPPSSLESKEMSLDLDSIAIKLGTVTSTFKNGVWTSDIPTTPEAIEEEATHLRNANEKIGREKNMLRVKNEILIDMVTTRNIKIKNMEIKLKELREILAQQPRRFAEDS